MSGPRIGRSFSEPSLRLYCRCGWDRHDDDINEWYVQPNHSWVVRTCPDCWEPVPG